MSLATENFIPETPFGMVLEADNGDSLFDLDKNELQKLILDESFIILRGFEALSNEKMCDFARQFGELLKWDFGYVLELQLKQNPQNHIFSEGRVELHWDGAFASVEPRFNFFQCLDGSAETGGGETTFLNTVKFLDSLPQDSLDMIKDIVISYQADKKAHYGGSIETPLVSKHPVTGKLRMQFIEPFNEDNADVNPVVTAIKGFEDEQNDRLLKQIIDWCYQSRYFYDHRWQKGDYVMVDNNALLHGRRRFQGTGLTRSLKRIHII
ncbi:TauD/TfdA dioxygenase family protein [Aliikangiella coralliicola]|uniref:TauD/TfdA family dioxygenase n=1 Tax=Aliikangiella coralliicola TaxID=2592383 RepID=A0A545U948_9GAMM|nr:TauD/TfdA family dioxygenase [Aliikangiella coralliicola]TQV85994.1 TauD/TfdA family dioxygenase [Aliikangiella coralliicola]